MKLFSILFLAATFAASSLAQTWYTNPANGHHYTLVDNNSSWTDAENKSVSLGGHLVTIRSGAENDWLFNWVLSITGDGVYGAWIGLSQLPNSPEPAGGWVWSSGEPVVYTNWQPGEPNNHGDENWAKMYVRQHDYDEIPSFWNDTIHYEPGRPDTVGIVEVVPVPEPVTMVLGAAGLGLALRRRRH